MTRLRKRALVVIVSNLRDEDDDTLAPALALLQPRHLVLFASLRESDPLARARRRASTPSTARSRYAATADYLRNRELAFRRLERGGTHVPRRRAGRAADRARSTAIWTSSGAGGCSFRALTRGVAGRAGGWGTRGPSPA